MSVTSVSGPVMGQCLDTLQALVGAGFGQAGIPGSVWCHGLTGPARASSALHSSPPAALGTALMCQAGLHEALFRIDLEVMPWHSRPFTLGLCHGMPGVTSVHGHYNTDTVSRYC